MKVSLLCFGALRDHVPGATPGRAVEVEVADGASVADVAEQLGMPLRSLFAVLVDGVSTDASHKLSEGAEVTLMPPFSGG